jgi:hypothetical protein
MCVCVCVHLCIYTSSYILRKALGSKKTRPGRMEAGDLTSHVHTRTYTHARTRTRTRTRTHTCNTGRQGLDTASTSMTMRLPFAISDYSFHYIINCLFYPLSYYHYHYTGRRGRDTGSTTLGLGSSSSSASSSLSAGLPVA